MDMQQQTRPMPEPDPGMCGCDRDVFLRVWDRVMPVERLDCPIVVERQEGCVTVPAVMQMPVPAAREIEAHGVSGVDRAGDDFPTKEDVPCLGSAGEADREKLQEMIGWELTAWRHYQNLTRRGGQGGRTLAALAEGCRRRAKRLSAALFLVSGVRFWPAGQTSVPAPRSYFAALREHFLAEQNRGQSYRAAAEESRDCCLRMLYLELAEECADHAGHIRTLLEHS